MKGVQWIGSVPEPGNEEFETQIETDSNRVAALIAAVSGIAFEEAVDHLVTALEQLGEIAQAAGVISSFSVTASADMK